MRYIDASQIASLITPADLVPVLRKAFADPGLTVPPRTQHLIPANTPGSLLIKPAWREGKRLGVKLITIMPGNTKLGLPSLAGVYVMFSATTGEPQAVLDGTSLTALRTAAVSALALDLLAPRDVRTMLLVGTGALAPQFARSHAAVRPLQRIFIWGRTEQKVSALVERLRAEGLPVEAASDLERAARASDIISCVTLATAPLIRGEWLRNGAHLDLVGSFRPEMREADEEAIAAGGLVIDASGALEESGDLIGPLRAGRISREDIPELSELVGGRRPRRGRITVFKSVGTSLADFAAAEEILRRLGS